MTFRHAILYSYNAISPLIQGTPRPALLCKSLPSHIPEIKASQTKSKNSKDIGKITK